MSAMGTEISKATPQPTFPQTIRFSLRRDSWHASFMTRTFIVVFASMAAISFVLSLVASFPFGLWWMVFLVATPLIAVWGWRRYSMGTAELNMDALVVKSSADTQTYPWEDIERVTTSTLEEIAGPDPWIFRTFRLNMRRPVAVLELRRQYRDSVVRARSGTRTGGIAIPGGLKVQIELEDVPGFVEAANQYLGAARSG